MSAPFPSLLSCVQFHQICDNPLLGNVDDPVTVILQRAGIHPVESVMIPGFRSMGMPKQHNICADCLGMVKERLRGIFYPKFMSVGQ